MTKILHRLSEEIGTLKEELYNTLESKTELNHKEAYLLSVKLDELIYQYQCLTKKKAAFCK